MYEYFKRVIVTENNVSNIYIHYWQLNLHIKPPNYLQVMILDYDGFRTKLKFNGSLVRQCYIFTVKSTHY